MLHLLPTRKVGVCFTLIAAYTFLVMAMVRRLGHYEPARHAPHPTSNSYITDCITGRILGRIPGDIVTDLIGDEKIGESDETREQRQKSFRKVFQTREWGDKVDKAYQGIQSSGGGSTLRYAQEVIAGLHQIIGAFKQQKGVSRVRLLDIPCGDMAWMSRFLKTRDDVDYTGMDIVPELIGNHTELFKKYPWKFRLQDIVEQPLNESYDIILCRMMLQHLYNRDALTILTRFSDSGSRYLLTTTFNTVAENTDLSKKLSKGRFHFLNLEIPPVSLAPPKCMFRDGEKGDPQGYFHFLGLWDLPLRKIRDCSKPSRFTLPGKNVMFYSCTNWTYSQP